MRISDWSSDVCSSDLSVRCRQLVKGRCAEPDALTKWPAFRRSWDFRGEYHRTKPQPGRSAAARCLQAGYIARLSRQATAQCVLSRGAGNLVRARIVRARSEEHTSELQSLMRISYAVFCLKKKTTKQTTESKKETRRLHVT